MVEIIKRELVSELKDNNISVKERLDYFNKLYKKVRKEVGIRKESYFRDKLADELGGETEVEVLNGFIDVATEDEIIEVKRKNRWKHAVGQVMVYGVYRENLDKRIHLIDDLSDCNEWLIEDACNRLGIKVSYEKDPVLEEIKNKIGEFCFNGLEGQVLL